MMRYLSHLDKRILGVIRKIGRELDKREISAYIVGGIVRDLLLKRENLDVDIVVEAQARGLVREMAGIFNARVKIYDQFGTATLELPSRLRVDLATARKERYVHPGALPLVEPGTLRDDLLRRDFTVNAMAVSINAGRFGELVDEFGGFADLRRKKIRVLHDRSFQDDPTRILRAVRFEQRFGFRIEEKTLSLLKKALAQGCAANVKPPRYFAEFRKMLSEGDPARCLRRLVGLRGLTFIDPEGNADLRLPAQVHRRLRLIQGKGVFYHQRSHRLFYLMALVEPLGAARIKDIARKFPLRKEEKECVEAASYVRDLLKRLCSPRLPRSQVYHILRPWPVEVILYLRLRTSSRRARGYIDRYLREDRDVRLRINGEDVQRLGISPGARLGDVLGHVLREKLDRKIRGRRQELAAARKWIHVSLPAMSKENTNGPH